MGRTQPARAAPAKNKLSRLSILVGLQTPTPPLPLAALVKLGSSAPRSPPIGTAGYWYKENAAASGRGPRRLHRVGKPSSEKSRLKSAPCPLLLTPTDICCLSFPSRTLPHKAALPSLPPSLHPYKAGPLQCCRSPLASHPHSLVSCALRKSLPFELTNTCRIRTLEEDKERFRPIGYRDQRRVGPSHRETAGSRHARQQCECTALIPNNSASELS
jgi:hypothetical protein